MNTVEHVIQKDEINPPNESTYEWKLTPPSDGRLDGFCLCYRKINSSHWPILVDASLDSGEIVVNLTALRNNGVKVRTR